MKIFPLGDSSITIDLGNYINETLNLKVLAIQQWLLANKFEGMKDIIVAYSSLSVFYDLVAVKKNYPEWETAFDFVRARLEEAWEKTGDGEKIEGRVIHLPVCYEEGYGTDLDQLIIDKGLSMDEIVGLHVSVLYRVYMLGFLPGFSYMGTIDDKLVTPRKSKPVPVIGCSVGIAGSQTGIYPLNSPGGWHIIGRTPVKQFDALADPPVKLNSGDHVKFYPITKREFEYGHW